MKDLLKKYEEQRPEIVFEWSDRETGAEGWVVINSLRGNAAGGGTRMRIALDRREVESLAKTMEVKFTVSGPQIGGAKSGINFDPKDPRKEEVLRRWFKVVSPLLRNYYGTGGDLNVEELLEVIPITEDYGIWHPQEGVVTGHFQPTISQKIHKIGQLRMGVSKVIEDQQFSPDTTRKYAVADMITGWGVAMAAIHQYEIMGSSIEGKRVIVQGWGNVGSAAAFYLAQRGASITGIIDRTGGLLAPQGLSFDEVRSLFLNKDGNALRVSNMTPFDEVNDKIWSSSAELFLPCASSRLITKEQVDLMLENGLEMVSCGANVPFADQEIFFGPIADYADDQAIVIPDFIANCGMARVFAYCMEDDVELSDVAIFEDTSRVIRKALENANARNNSEKGLSKSAFEIALEKLT